MTGMNKQYDALLKSNELHKQYDELLKRGEKIEKKLLEVEKSQNNKLTDQQVDEIASTLTKESMKDPMLKMIANLPSNQGITKDDNKLDVTSEQVTVTVNPNTGEKVVTGSKKEETKSDMYITDTFEDLWEKAQAAPATDFNKIELSDDLIKEEAERQFNMKAIDIDTFLNVVKEYKAGNTKNLYNRLPNPVKMIVNAGADTSGADNITPAQIIAAKNSVAKTIIDTFISDVAMNNAVIDFNTEMNKLFANANVEINGMFYESIQSKLDQLDQVIDLVKKNEEDDEETKSRKIEQLTAVGNSIRSAISMEDFMNRLPRIKIKNYDIERPDKIFNSFDQKYMNSVYKIHSVSLLPKVLNREFGEQYSIVTICKFVLAFCKYTMNMNPSNMVDHTFMYYFISNIIFLNTETDNPIEKEVRSNIEKCLQIIEK